MTKTIQVKRTKERSMAGSLRKYYKNTTLKNILKDLQEERRKNNIF